MTLSTDLFVLDPVNPEEIYSLANGLLCAEDGRDPESVQVERRPGAILNKPDQGLAAWLMIYYGLDGPVEPDHEDDWVAWPKQPYCVSINWDTAYGYRADNGAGCSDLHAFFIDAVGRFLDDRGVRWCWVNEFTGEGHEGREGLLELGDPTRGRLPMA